MGRMNNEDRLNGKCYTRGEVGRKYGKNWRQETIFGVLHVDEVVI